MTEEKDHEIFVSIVGGKAREKNVLDRNRLVPALTYQGGHLAHSDQQTYLVRGYIDKLGIKKQLCFSLFSGICGILVSKRSPVGSAKFIFASLAPSLEKNISMQWSDKLVTAKSSGVISI